MEQTKCAKCGAKILPGWSHTCAGLDYHTPVALDILSELKRIRELLESQQRPKDLPVETVAESGTKALPDGQTKARKRETR